MKFKELQNMDPKELVAKLDEIHTELMKQNAQIATGTTPKSPGQVKQMKKTIAKIRSILAKNNE